MKYFLLLLFACIVSMGSLAQAEDLGVFKIDPHTLKTISYKSTVGQVLAFKVIQGPELPERQRGFQFGWKKQSVFCEGKQCAKSGGYLLFCPEAGVIKAEMNNLSAASFEIELKRIECEGKDAGTMQCPSASTLKAMCG